MGDLPNQEISARFFLKLFSDLIFPIPYCTPHSLDQKYADLRFCVLEKSA